MSTICKTCGQHKQEVRCPDCRGIWGFFSSSCERCNSSKYILECPDQKDHDLDENLEKLRSEIGYRDETEDRTQITTPYDTSRSTQPGGVCWKCHGTDFITEMVKVPNYLTPWPPFRYEKQTVRCPVCKRGY